MTWQFWLPVVVQGFPLAAAVWSPVSPRKKLQVKQVIGDLNTSDQPACEGQTVKSGKAVK